GADGGGERGAGGVHGDRDAAAGGGAHHPGVQVDGGALGQAARGDQQVRPGVEPSGDRAEQVLGLLGGDPPGGVDLGGGPGGVHHGDVVPGGLGDADRQRGHAVLGEQFGEVLALGAADRHHGGGRHPVGVQRAGDVDALAAGVGGPALRAQHLPGGERGHLQRPVDAGVGGDGADHRVLSRSASPTRGPAA